MLPILALLLCAIVIEPGASAAAVTSQSDLATRANEIMQQRCVVCHGCYDAPCQLKLEAQEGLLRGASKDLVYNSARLLAGDLTRLFDDGLNEQQWRDKGFYPVIDTKHSQQGVMHRMLELKQANPLPPNGPLPDGFDFSLYRDQQCSRQDDFDKFARDYPLWGMPYGLPGLNIDEHRTMTSWLRQGASPAPRKPLDDFLQGSVQQWEKFLNGSSKREQLMSRYIFEHLFLAAVYLREGEEITWFRLVRSSSPPGEEIRLIATRRPYDDPGSSPFHYRLQRMPVAVLDKSHLPYRLDQARMAWYRSLFLEPDYVVEQLPGYAPKIASNPFDSFQAIPVNSRYRFLLGEARFTIMNFIKGPVCRGQVALNVIDDHFWVMFTNPDNFDPEHDGEFLSGETNNLRLPLARSGTVVDLLAWRRYARSAEKYQRAKADYVEQQLEREHRKITADGIWDGDGTNDNAALTIFRHFDTASVVKGFVGDVPKTAWVIDYSLLERIHYLLVAGYDVYGAVSHQLESRLYMDFLRMEAEFNFLMFLPVAQRTALREHWYRDAPTSSRDYFLMRSELAAHPSDVSFATGDAKAEFLRLMRGRIHSAQARRYDYRVSASAPMIQAFGELEKNAGVHNSYLPQVVFLNVIGSQRDEAYSIVRNSGYANIAQLFREQKRRLPAEDRLTVARGFLGAYPNYFFQVNESEIPRFAADVASLDSEAAYFTLLERYGVRRNAPWFWQLSDKFHRMYRAQNPVEAGLFDYNRYSGR